MVFFFHATLVFGVCRYEILVASVPRTLRQSPAILSTHDGEQWIDLSRIHETPAFAEWLLRHGHITSDVYEAATGAVNMYLACV